jgi:hypothetical protein
LIVVKPEMVIRWYRKGFKLFWKFKSRRKGPGRSLISSDIRDLVRRMAKANPLWGAPRIHGELLKLGIEISERTVSNLMSRRDANPPSQRWGTFLKIICRTWSQSISSQFQPPLSGYCLGLSCSAILGDELSITA